MKWRYKPNNFQLDSIKKEKKAMTNNDIESSIDESAYDDLDVQEIHVISPMKEIVLIEEAKSKE